MMVDAPLYLGNYDFKKRKSDGCQIFHTKTSEFRLGRSKGNLQIKHSFPSLIPADSLMADLQMYKKKIEELEMEADNYDSRHVNQNFRRINAECYRTQSKLDRLKVEGREDAQTLRKSLIVRAERAAEKLGCKIHPKDLVPCPICLKLA